MEATPTAGETPAIISDLFSEVLPNYFGMPSPVIDWRTVDGAHYLRSRTVDVAHYLSSVTLPDLLRYDVQAVHQYVMLRHMFGGADRQRIPSARTVVGLFEHELCAQRHAAMRRRDIRCNVAMVWRPTKLLLERLLFESGIDMHAHYSRQVDSMSLGEITMTGLRIIATDEPGIRVAWVPSLQD